MRSSLPFFVAVAAFGVLACDSGRSANQGGEPDLAPPPIYAHPDGSAVDPGTQMADLNCGGMQFKIDRIAPNVLLVLDRSGSMNQPIAFGSATSKWDDLRSAMSSVLAQYDAQVRFGVDLFGDPSSGGHGGASCSPGTIAVAVGDKTGSQVLAAINATMPSTATPTAATMDVVIASKELTDTTRDNFVVLATDGQPNCGDTDVTSRIASLYNAKPSVKTWVIGVGGDTASNPALLDEWAVAGHTDRAGATKYYQANSPQDLQDAFSQIAGGVVSCSFKLAQQPPDPKQLYVWEDGKMVALDAGNGYTYDATGQSITLHGSACDLLRNDPNTKVAVLYGCPNPPGPS